MSDKPIYITQFDKDRLVALILDSMGTSYRRSEYLSKLREELARARVKILPLRVVLILSNCGSLVSKSVGW